MKTEENASDTPEFVVSRLDWDILRDSQASDYTGSTGFERMSALDRLRWLDMTVEFISKNVKKVKEPI